MGQGGGGAAYGMVDRVLQGAGGCDSVAVYLVRVVCVVYLVHFVL